MKKSQYVGEAIQIYRLLDKVWKSVSPNSKTEFDPDIQSDSARFLGVNMLRKREEEFTNWPKTELFGWFGYCKEVIGTGFRPSVWIYCQNKDEAERYYSAVRQHFEDKVSPPTKDHEVAIICDEADVKGDAGWFCSVIELLNKIEIPNS